MSLHMYIKLHLHSDPTHHRLYANTTFRKEIAYPKNSRTRILAKPYEYKTFPITHMMDYSQAELLL